MNEEQVASQVAKNIQVEEHFPAPAIDEPPQPSSFDSNIALGDPMFSEPLSDYFGLDRIAKFTEETQRQMRIVLEWANKQTGSKELGDILPLIQSTEAEMGIMLKPDRLARLARIIQLQNQARAVQAQIDGAIYG